MPASRRQRGIAGENAARAYLGGLGREIIGVNYRTRFGEIDIIARHGDTICFVEVRGRSHGGAVSPAESVDYRKRRKLIRTAEQWIAESGCEAPCRFDIIEVDFEGGAGRISGIIEGAIEIE